MVGEEVYPRRLLRLKMRLCRGRPAGFAEATVLTLLLPSRNAIGDQPQGSGNVMSIHNLLETLTVSAIPFR